jgi:hypothetical protein
MLHVRRQPAGGFLQSIHERCYLGASFVLSCNGERGFFKLLQLGPQRLAVLVHFLQ